MMRGMRTPHVYAITNAPNTYKLIASSSSEDLLLAKAQIRESYLGILTEGTCYIPTVAFHKSICLFSTISVCVCV